MSESPSTSVKQVVGVETHPSQSRQAIHLPVIHGGATTTATATNISSSLAREYRKGNWTIQETLVLITAKKLDEERRIKASSTPPDPATKQTPAYGRTGELRWKWVENYCWSNGCLRSQNQCNDKWDNLLRDYKKIREYELRSQQSDGSAELPSYWAMDKQDRKERNLPSNMVSEVYEALKDVVQKRYSQRSSSTTTSTTYLPIQAPPISVHAPAPAPASPAVAPPAISESSDSSETEWSEKFDSDTKRRKVRGIGPSIVRSATILAKTLRSHEEKEERRHREVMELEERRLRLEETRNEVNSQGIAGLIAAVNNLSGAIQSLISDRHHQT